jgi:hypothetical protein
MFVLVVGVWVITVRVHDLRDLIVQARAERFGSKRWHRVALAFLLLELTALVALRIGGGGN